MSMISGAGPGVERDEPQRAGRLSLPRARSGRADDSDTDVTVEMTAAEKAQYAAALGQFEVPGGPGDPDRYQSDVLDEPEHFDEAEDYAAPVPRAGAGGFAAAERMDQPDRPERRALPGTAGPDGFGPGEGSEGGSGEGEPEEAEPDEESDAPRFRTFESALAAREQAALEERCRAAAEDDPEAASLLGSLLLRRGDLDEAETHLRRAAAAGLRAGANNLGVLLHQRGRRDEAADWWRRPRSPAARLPRTRSGCICVTAATSRAPSTGCARRPSRATPAAPTPTRTCWSISGRAARPRSGSGPRPRPGTARGLPARPAAGGGR
ncbi:tetratricopeptide repeat protein [Streptacidiphilus sp. 4-A2]|nr:tetratricopeptide repeat protein [Streptacidiphilus sp. 4-A2]